MNISVVIPTYDRSNELIDCIHSLETQSDPPSEIIVINDGAYDQIAKELRTAGLDRIIHIEGPANGLAAARNAGIERANCEIVAFIDDDVILPPNWTQELKRAYEDYPEAAGIGGYVLNYNPQGINKANVNSFGYRLLQAFRQVFFYSRVGKISPVGILWAPHTLITGGPRSVDVLQGCNMSFRSSVLEKESFDEWYGTSGSAAAEEIDYGARLSADGRTLIYDPRIVVIHKRTIESDDGGRSGDPNYGNMTNLTYFLLKHPEKSVWNVLLLAIFIGIYSLAKGDTGYFRGVIKGVIEFHEQNKGH